MVSRIYVEKKPGFDVEAQQLKGELTEILGIKGIEALRIINRYDVEPGFLLHVDTRDHWFLPS